MLFFPFLNGRSMNGSFWKIKGIFIDRLSVFLEEIKKGAFFVIFEEKTVTTEEIFKGKIIRVRRDMVEMPDKSLAEREIVEHPGGVGVVALTEDNEIYLVNQYRKPFDMSMYEIPAGKLDKGEKPEVCGARELEEETGLKAKTFEYLGKIFPSPGFTDEITYICLAKDLYQGTVNLDEDEYLDVVKVPLKKALEMVENGEICDAKSVVGILKALL